MVEWSGLLLNKCQSRLSQTVGHAFRNTWQALKPTFPPSPYIACTPHTPINSPLLPGLAHWTDSKGLSAGIPSRMDKCPQKNERTTQPRFEHNDFDQYQFIVTQPWELGKNVQLALIGSRPHAFQRAIDEPSTLPRSPPKGGTKSDFAVFASKIQLLSK